MSETHTRQRLAAILAADAVGYSRLMSADDRATVAALDAARAIFRQYILASQGRVVDMAGDSVLAVFETAAGAVSAALAVQRDLETGTNEVPSEQRLLFRIGVHLGDVIEKADGTIYGDGVNIAARLQALAPSGGIVISDAVRGSVKNRVAARFVDLGKQAVKNITEPVRAFQVQGANAKALSVARPATGRWIAAAVAAVAALVAGAGWYVIHGASSLGTSERTDAKSIAVLPFANLSEDKDTAYFADGVHEDLLTQLALLGDLRVVSRVSVMDYRNTKKNVKQIGSELGVASLVEGSVRRAGNQVRVTAQLIDAKSDKHLWAKTYDRELKDVFAIQSELATEIARSLKVSLEPHEQARLAKKPTDNVEAYDLFLRYEDLVRKRAGSIASIGAVPERIELLSKAVALDPEFALAWARLAVEHARAYSSGIDATAARLAKAADAFNHAQALARDDPLVRIAAGHYYIDATMDLARAAQAFEQVLVSAPNNVDALAGMADVHLRKAQWGERIALLERALAIDARNPGTLTGLVNQYRDFRRFDRAQALQQQLISLRPDDLDLQAKFYMTEYWRTGSWEAFDTWRRGLPSGAEAANARVMFVDLDRAVARRDFTEALRLLRAPQANDLKAYTKTRDDAFSQAWQAFVLYAEGGKARAAKTAQAALRLLDAELHATSDQGYILTTQARLFAMLGQREVAFATLAKAVDNERSVGNLRWAERTQRDALQLHALLGDRSEALEELSRQLKLPAAQPNDLRNDALLASLWDDPRFQSIVNDPANNAPISFDVR